MPMKYNKSPMSLREGSIFLDGVEVADSVKAEIKFTPEVWTGRTLGEKAKSSRWLGYTITVSVTRRRSTGFTKDMIKEYIASGKTPEYTIQGIMNDTNSDYYAEVGSDVVTAVGCVRSGDMILTQLDSGGEIVEETLTFNAYDVV